MRSSRREKGRRGREFFDKSWRETREGGRRVEGRVEEERRMREEGNFKTGRGYLPSIMR